MGPRGKAVFPLSRDLLQKDSELNWIDFSLSLTPVIMSHLPESGKVIARCCLLGFLTWLGPGEEVRAWVKHQANAVFHAEGLCGARMGSIMSVSSPGLPCAPISFVLMTSAEAWLAWQAQGT